MSLQRYVDAQRDDSCKRAAGMETDEEFCARIVYVAGEAELNRELRLGAKFDAIAERYGLKRRKIDREATLPIKRVVDAHLELFR